MKKRLFVMVLLLVTLLTGTSLNSGRIGLAQEGEPIKIGAIFDLSGATGDVGTPYSVGVVGYVDWVNANGGVEGRPIELLSQDYAYDVATAENLYVQYVEEGVVAFMGWGTGDTEALRGRVAEDQVPFMSASYSAALNDPAGEAPYNFLVGTTYSDQLVIMLQYMLDEWVADGGDPAEMKVVFFHHDSPFGTSPLEDGEAFASENGIETMRIAMPRGATSYEAELTRADEFGVTHIIVQNVSTPAALLVSEAADFGLLEDIEFGCLNWCADEILIELAGEDAEGVLGALPFGPTTVEVPGQEIPSAWLDENDMTLEEATLHFTQGWWTMAVMVEGIRLTLAAGQELTGENIKANLETITEFDTGGITAPITFTPEDHRGNRSLTIFSVEDGVWTAASDVIDLRAEE
ncbi:MAG: branched-chain amino acid ABC transporter substrate-binding protein [Chloroflexota bacterium]|nr:branched-chain amino acid ABC transporter substrate-binding protein [Chloroflexota bacterium]NOG63479.1 ABC transporter substrate-binding protein [Chloroflexota bacterium]GIK62338.1 MAG: branched-chain amino acid ABC transporter substrate-binding protein [Chloroflexota bacterium]